MNALEFSEDVRNIKDSVDKTLESYSQNNIALKKVKYSTYLNILNPGYVGLVFQLGKPVIMLDLRLIIHAKALQPIRKQVLIPIEEKHYQELKAEGKLFKLYGSIFADSVSHALWKFYRKAKEHGLYN